MKRDPTPEELEETARFYGSTEVARKRLASGDSEISISTAPGSRRRVIITHRNTSYDPFPPSDPDAPRPQQRFRGVDVSALAFILPLDGPAAGDAKSILTTYEKRSRRALRQAKRKGDRDQLKHLLEDCARCRRALKRGDADAAVVAMHRLAAGSYHTAMTPYLFDVQEAYWRRGRARRNQKATTAKKLGEERAREALECARDLRSRKPEMESTAVARSVKAKLEAKYRGFVLNADTLRKKIPPRAPKRKAGK